MEMDQWTCDKQARTLSLAGYNLAPTNYFPLMTPFILSNARWVPEYQYWNTGTSTGTSTSRCLNEKWQVVSSSRVRWVNEGESDYALEVEVEVERTNYGSYFTKESRRARQIADRPVPVVVGVQRVHVFEACTRTGLLD